MGKHTNVEVVTEIDLDGHFCICCHKNPVTWPLVCDQCQDSEKQERLFNHYVEKGLAGWKPDPKTGEETRWCKITCPYCGMIHDLELTCYYCGILYLSDEDDGKDEGDDFEDECLDQDYIKYRIV